MKTWGHYELVGAPSDADLSLEIRFTVRPGLVPGLVQRGDTAYWDAQFRLAIRDPKSHARLWALTEQVEKAILQGKRDKNFQGAARDSQ